MTRPRSRAAPHTAAHRRRHGASSRCSSAADHPRSHVADLGFSTKTATCSIIQRGGSGDRPGRGRDHGRCGADAPGDGAGGSGPFGHRTQPLGGLCRGARPARSGCRAPTVRAVRSSRAPRPRRAAPTPRSRPWPRRVTPPGAPRSTSPWSPARTTGGRRRAPTPSSRRGWPGSSIGVEDPDPLVAGRGVAALREAGIDVTRRRGGGRGCRAARALPQAPHDRAAVGRPEAGRQPRRPYRRARRHQPLDHRGGGPPGRRTSCGLAPTPCSSGRAPSGPTTPS